MAEPISIDLSKLDEESISKLERATGRPLEEIIKAIEENNLLVQAVEDMAKASKGEFLPTHREAVFTLGGGLGVFLSLLIAGNPIGGAIVLGVSTALTAYLDARKKEIVNE